MRLLVIGSGGREHALAWKLAQSPLVSELLIAPGNAGTASLGKNLPIETGDIDGLLAAAKEHRVDLTVVGPEAPLVAGIVDRFTAAGLKAFGPSAAAARIEGSKAWAKDLMIRHGIPTGWVKTFTDADAARRFSREQPEGSIVIKADGLAAGKGVTVPSTYDEADEAITTVLEKRAFGASGSKLLIEERLAGREVSVFAFISGATVSAEVAACDYKRINDGDNGPNTGGMGGYAPPEFWTPELAAQVRDEIMSATAKAMVDDKSPFTGVLYAGVMVTDDGPKVFEFNCRFGDPEAQLLMPRLDSDLAEICQAAVDNRLHKMNVTWRSDPCVGVVMASGGYPNRYKTGLPITGLDGVGGRSMVFHAGTKLGPSGEVLTAGGRVLIAVGEGKSLRDARKAAYSAVAAISFEGAHYRKDIADRALTTAARS